jgi:hypothetical protein
MSIINNASKKLSDGYRTFKRNLELIHFYILVTFGIIAIFLAYLSTVFELYSEFLIGFSVALFAAAFVSGFYGYFTIKDVGYYVANTMIMDKNFLYDVFSNDQRKKILDNYLDVTLGKGLSKSIKGLIYRTFNENKSYVLQHYVLNIQLDKIEKNKCDDFYKISFTQSSYEYLYSKTLIFYATNDTRISSKFAEIVKDNPESGIVFVWMLPNSISKKFFDNCKKKNGEEKEKIIREIFDIPILKIQGIPISGKTIVHDGVELSPDLTDLCYIEKNFDITEILKEYSNKQVQIDWNFHSLIFKYKQFLHVILDFPYNGAFISWDARNTDIKKVKVVTSINNLFPNSPDDNKKHTINTLEPGMPDNTITYVWSFNEEKDIY